MTPDLCTSCDGDDVTHWDVDGMPFCAGCWKVLCADYNAIVNPGGYEG